MKKFWHEGAYESYKKATRYVGYPEVPFGPMIRKVLRPTDRVADIGCGFGVVSLSLAKRARQVLAIDQDAAAIALLERDSAAEGIDNIETMVAVWPDIETAPWDVAIAFYHNAFAESTEKVEQLLRYTKREGLMTAQHPRGRESFHEPLSKALGLDQHGSTDCANGCYARGRLEQAGFSCTCQLVRHDFGQPADTFDEAITFMMSQLRLGPERRPEVEALASQYVQQECYKWYIPIRRYNCLIHFQK